MTPEVRGDLFELLGYVRGLVRYGTVTGDTAEHIKRQLNALYPELGLEVPFPESKQQELA